MKRNFTHSLKKLRNIMMVKILWSELLYSHVLHVLCFLIIADISQAVRDCPRECTCVSQVMHCEGRGLQRLPNFHGTLSVLLTDLSRNNINEINISDIKDLQSRFLNISQNNIQRIIPLPESQEETIVQIEDTLNISHNMLTSFPAELLNVMPFVDVIDLSYNMMTSLSAAIFVKHADLERVILSHNHLSQVHPKAFLGPENLKEVDLRFNFVTKLAPNFEIVVETLFLSGNPWHCDCNERWMLENRLITNSPYPPACMQPAAVSGRSVASLQAEDFVCAPRYNNGSLLIQSMFGSKVELICPAVGDPVVTEVVWSFGGQIPSFTIASSPDKPLIIKAVTESTVGRYWCTAWNKGGNLTMSISLSIRRSYKPTTHPDVTPTTEEDIQVDLNSTQNLLPVSKDSKVPIVGIFALTSVVFFMFFIVVALLAYTCQLRNRLKRKRPSAGENAFFWQTSCPITVPYTNTEPATLPSRDQGYMHLVRNFRHYNNQERHGYRDSGYRDDVYPDSDETRRRSFMHHPPEYASTRKRMLPVGLPVVPTLDRQGMSYGYDCEHLYDTLGARCFSSCSESSGSQSSVAI